MSSRDRPDIVQHTTAGTRHPTAGFTVLEVLITVLIIAILLGVAIPSYVQHVRRSARTETQAFMMDAAARQQQYLVDRRSYASSTTALGVTPSAHVTAKYTIAVLAAGGPRPTFLLSATPAGDQAADSCGTLSIDSQGNRSPAACW